MKGEVMEQAFILIEVQVGRAEEVARRVSSFSGVVKVEVVTGPYDVIVRARAQALDGIRSCLLSMVQSDPYVTRALLCPVGHPEAGQPQPIGPEPFAIQEPEPLLVSDGTP